MLEGMQVGVGAVITAVVFEMGAGILKQRNILFILIMIGSFCMTEFLHVNVVLIILSCMFIGVCKMFVKKRTKQ